ncbi:MULTISPECIES: acyl-CoA dehydrogenase family protein [unclassified Aurantimonas]|uniref:acyl-CoA dehydrogenase family protein n=1 Tax=unclassified Aurantimonas TaxID=2638230 RepID=UPI002E16F802|nr:MULTISPECIES: acyl-CoA dehydrogenase family protein [unclassified Aurantimonas]MEC5293113.1 acyl-CoA dehydrogenase family protein [Aurantimonas sp. C2-3-R2]MEC5414182.1 acyl-CoA dehydrogenase family protein [Aurantimonas sp. C2-4-R8]
MDRFFTDEQRLLQRTVRRFAEEAILPVASAIDRDDEFPSSLYRGLAGLGLFGVSLPEEAGGSGLDTTAACIAMEEIARCSGTVGNAFALPVEAAHFLNEHGNDFHKGLIPAVLNGDLLPATAATEPDCGSDVAAMRTTADRDGDDYVVNGTKAWVTFGRIADFIMVFAKTDRNGGHKGISCILIETDRPGVTRGRSEKLLGMHGLEDCQVVFDNVRVPMKSRLGLENNAFKMAMSNFNLSRLMMSSMALGMAQAAMEDAITYAKSRKQFGSEIIKFQAVQFMLADMSMDISAARLLIHHAARLYDVGHPIAKEAAHAKLFTTDMAMKHVSNALQIHGGNGYSKEYRIERIFRDVRLSQIYEGTNQIQRLIIARQLEKDFL